MIQSSINRVPIVLETELVGQKRLERESLVLHGVDQNVERVPLATFPWNGTIDVDAANRDFAIPKRCRIEPSQQCR